MVHRIIWRVASPAALDFWAERLAERASRRERDGDRLRFADPEGLEHELRSPTRRRAADRRAPRDPRRARAPGLPRRPRLHLEPDASERLLETPRLHPRRGRWEARGDNRGSLYAYDEPPAGRGIQGAGTVHHVAWASTTRTTRPGASESARRRAPHAGDRPPLLPLDLLPRAERRAVRDRDRSPGFTVDEPLEHLGEKLSIPPFLEGRRPEIEATVRPLENPRVAARS